MGTRRFIEREQAQEQRRARQGELYDGLYDGIGTVPIVVPRGVRILNPMCGDIDATSRRFARLEIE